MVAAAGAAAGAGAGAAGAGKIAGAQALGSDRDWETIL